MGGITGALDEILFDHKIIDKHYLTFGTIGTATINLLGWFNPIISSFVGTILGAVAANYEEEICKSFLAPLKIADELYDTYSKIIKKQRLDAHIEKQGILLFGGQLLVQVLSLKMKGYEEQLTYNFERLDNRQSAAFGKLKSGITNIAIFLFPYTIGTIFTSTANNYLGKKLEFAVEDQLRSELFSEENLLSLSHDDHATVLIDKFQSDTSNMVNSGTGLITNAISSSINSVYGVGIVIVSSPNIFIYSVLYDQACSFISNYLITKQTGYWEKTDQLKANLITGFKHDAGNIRTIVERDGVAFTAKKIEQITTSIREHEETQKLWGIVSRT